MAPALSYTGRILACEEYALRGEDFCKWARQPNRGVDARRSLALENRFPLAHGGGAHHGSSDWRPWHLLLILLVVVCVALMARDELRRTGGGGGWHHRDEEEEEEGEEGEEEERENNYENGKRGAAAFSGRMSFKRTLRRKVDVVEREGLPWKCS